jgi:hypothetical protein
MTVFSFKTTQEKLWAGKLGADAGRNPLPKRLTDRGLVYHRDVFLQDDVTWFLLGKRCE